MQKKITQGFTIVELMITILVAAILVGIASPSFRILIENNRITKVSNEYTTAFRLARSNALSKGLATFICPSDNAGTETPTCGADWTNGFIVFSKPANALIQGPGVFNGGDTLILQSDFGVNESNSITASATNPAGTFFGFSPEGFTWQSVAYTYFT